MCKEPSPLVLSVGVPGSGKGEEDGSLLFYPKQTPVCTGTHWALWALWASLTVPLRERRGLGGDLRKESGSVAGVFSNRGKHAVCTPRAKGTCGVKSPPCSVSVRHRTSGRPAQRKLMSSLTLKKTSNAPWSFLQSLGCQFEVSSCCVES